MNRSRTIEYKSSFTVSQRSPPHMKMMTIKKQLKKCMGRLDKVLKKGAQVELWGRRWMSRWRNFEIIFKMSQFLCDEEEGGVAPFLQNVRLEISL
jgi:hypothetical protein